MAVDAGGGGGSIVLILTSIMNGSGEYGDV